MKILPFFIIVVIGVSACSNPVNRKTAANYHQRGLEAEWAGNYALAERDYSRALINARLGNAPDASIAMAIYNLGRIKGYLCKDREAEKLLKEALDIEEKVSGPESLIMAKRLFELARFYYDHDQYKRSLPYYARAVPMVRKFDIKKKDPIAFANALREYGEVLSRVGQRSKAESVLGEASSIEKTYPELKAEFVPDRYNGCAVQMPRPDFRVP